ncbi:hypothetical protein EVAR_27219_1 [Eumeta japonica]|uniref:Uncharacterized protein n=1 Tax=Eumeta variegata TaxID=151549 RepID=A0A4C1VUK2_EUMVA|nr:hypothetical protein EVAR_27219_1 [Eumeta japonica]
MAARAALSRRTEPGEFNSYLSAFNKAAGCTLPIYRKNERSRHENYKSDFTVDVDGHGKVTCRIVKATITVLAIRLLGEGRFKFGSSTKESIGDAPEEDWADCFLRLFQITQKFANSYLIDYRHIKEVLRYSYVVNTTSIRNTKQIQLLGGLKQDVISPS